MNRLIVLIGLCIFWHNSSVAEVKIQLLDQSGAPVEHAVVSFLHNEQSHQSAAPLEDASEAKPKTLPPAVMDQVDKQFSPRVLLVQPGQAVVFPNSDQVRHHVYSFSKPNDFEIRLYSGNQTEPEHFDHPGVVVLGCNIHDQMVGYLYVQGEESAKISDANGLVVFDRRLPDEVTSPSSVSIWHSQLSSNKTDRVNRLLKEKNDQGVWTIKLNLLPEAKKNNTRKFKPRYF